MRSYDQVGRLGGDEFMLLLPATEDGTARQVLDRALAALAQTRLPDGAAVTVSTGVADWRLGESGDHLVERADRLLLDAKAARPRCAERPRGGDAPQPPTASANDEEHLQRLVTAGALGTGLARLLNRRAIMEAVITGLHVHLGYERCLVMRREADGTLESVAAARPQLNRIQAEQPACDRLDTPSITRRAVLEGQPVMINDAEPDGSSGGSESAGMRSGLAVPIFVTHELWGAITVQSSKADAFQAADARLLQRVADHVGSALRTAVLYRTLEQTYRGTAAALAAALEARDAYTADHARSIADLAVDLGRTLHLDEDELRDVHYGALFHDIGKIAVPDAILNKPTALDEEEMSVIREHPLVGERILEPLVFMSAVRRIVRHDHERWDGAGYPDGLRGDDIPLGARIVFVVDAFDAMTSERPYRKAMSRSRARREMQRHVGTQFDPAVVRALFATLDAKAEAGVSAR